MSYYLGKNPEKWKESVDLINKLHVQIFPSCLTKGTDEEFNGVHENFPRITQINKRSDQSDADDENIKASIEGSFDNFAFVENALKDNDIDVDNPGARDEISALVIFKNTKDFMKILEKRIDCDKKHQALKNQLLELIDCEFNNLIQLKRLKIESLTHIMDKELLKTELMNSFEKYDMVEKAMLQKRDTFYRASKDCAALEGKDFSISYNNNYFVNYHAYSNGCTIRGMNQSTYLNSQRELWADMLRSITIKIPKTIQVSGDSEVGPEQAYKESKQLECRSTMLIKLNKDTEENLETLNLIDLQISLKDLENQRTSLLEVMSKAGCSDLEEKELVADKSKKLIRLVSTKIEEKQNLNRINNDRKRQEVNTNIKALGTVKMTVLTGFGDYLAWRKSQKYLNSHIDPFKKGATLLSTLKNDEDIARCSGIYDFDILMQILEQKYSHQEKLIPSMINRLRKLPEPHEDNMMLSNIGMILNIYSQLSEMSLVAVSRFDSTVIEDLVTKLTHRVQMDWEEHLILREQSPSVNELEESEFNDNQSVISGESEEIKRAPLDVNSEESKRKRVLFIAFLKRKETIIQNMKARKIVVGNNFYADKKKCRNCKLEISKCKCSKGKPRHLNYQVSTEVRNCPVCNATKMHLNIKQKPTTSLGACPKFREMSLENKKDMVKKSGACFTCLLVDGHGTRDCFIKTNCKICSKQKHHPQLCNERKFVDRAQNPTNGNRKDNRNKPKPLNPIVETEEVHAVQSSRNNSVLAVSSGKLFDHKEKGFKSLYMLWDTASTTHFIKSDVAIRHGYSGYPTMVNIARLGLKPQLIRCFKYFVILKDREGKTYKIEALGVPTIGYKKQIDNSLMANLSEKFDVPIRSIDNVEGEINFLFGLSDYSIFPKHFKSLEEFPNLALLQSKIGKPYVLVGSIKCLNEDQISCNFINSHDRDYWMSDTLGLNLDPKCSVCIKAPPCKQCKILNMPITYKEQQEGELIRNSITFDYNKKEVRITYPYQKNVNELFAPNKSNRHLAEKMAITLRKSLDKDNLLLDYTENSFLDMERRGAIRELSRKEIIEWESAGGPVNYCSHHAVLKDTSLTTKCRSVCNSSLSHNGTTLNATLPKGPSALSNLLHVLLRFRSKPYLVITDMTKAYNSIKTSPLECHLRRLLWYRPSDLEEENPKLREFGMISMAFGDTPAAYYLECAKQEISMYIRKELKEEKLADDIIQCSYVDDFALPVDSLAEAKRYANKIPPAFNVLGFNVKDVYVGGQGVKPEKLPESNHLFGHMYDMVSDTIELKLIVNFSRRKRSQRIGKNLTSETDLTNYSFTKRMILSLLASQFDPLGLISCFLAKYKIFLAHLFRKNYDWDVTLDKEDNKKALVLVKEMIKGSESSIKFARANKPKESKMQKLVCFVDASSVCLQVALYGVYVTKEGQTVSSLLTAKNRIANLTIPKNELNSLVAGHRLVLNFLEAVPETEIIEDINFISDSTCSLDSLHPDYSTRDVFNINRISEIRKAARKMNKNVNYFWISSGENVADYGTRSNCSLDFLSSKLWQTGPEFLKNISESSAILKITIDVNGNIEKTSRESPCRNPEPDSEILSAATIITKSTSNDIWDDLLERTNNLGKVLRTYCLIKSCLKNKTFLVKKSYTVAEKNDAFLFFIKRAQKKIPPEDLKSKQLLIFESNGVMWTQMRYPTSLMINVFGKQKLPVISGKTKFAKLLLIHAHIQNDSIGKGKIHNGIRQSLINSRVGSFGTYITHAKQCIRSMIKGCPVCRRLDKEAQNSVMAKNASGFGEIPENYSPFNKIAMDYFGPFWAVPPKTRETRIKKKYKIYGMVILCLHTRAIKVLPVEGYDQQSFLTAFKIHCANHGVPSHIISDPMSSFLAGAKSIGKSQEIEIDENGKPDKNKFKFEEDLTMAYGIDWKFILPGSQFRDPAERSVKSVKTLMYTVFNTEHNRPNLTLNEYWSLFADISEILNRRPIQGTLSEDTIQFVSPNLLLLGRTSKDPPMNLPAKLETKERLEMMHSIKQEFWKCLMNTLAADSQLMKYPCWYKQTSKPEKGDIILVLYKSKVQDNYRIGLIDSVSKDGRNLEVFVSPVQDGTQYNFKHVRKMSIPIQRSILVYSPKHD